MVLISQSTNIHCKHSQPVQILSSSAVLECDVCKLKYYMNIYNMDKVSSGTKSKTMAVTSTGKCVDRLTEKLSFQMAFEVLNSR